MAHSAPTQALSPIEYDVDLPSAVRRSGIDFSITQLSAAMIIKVTIDRFFSPDGSWEDLRDQLIKMGRAVVPSPPAGSRPSKALTAELLRNTIYDGCEQIISNVLFGYINDHLMQAQELLLDELAGRIIVDVSYSGGFGNEIRSDHALYRKYSTDSRVAAFARTVRLDKLRKIIGEDNAQILQRKGEITHVVDLDDGEKIEMITEMPTDDKGNVVTAKMPAGFKPLTRSETLPPAAVAQVITEIHHVVNIYAPGQTADRDMLCVYCTTGENAGLYELNVDHIATLARAYAPDLNDRSVKEVVGRVRALAPRRERTIDPDLLPLGNGLFDYRTKRLMPFSPDIVITGKAAMHYNPDARDVAIPEPHVDGCIRTDCIEGSVCGGQTWSVESWMRSLSDDPEIVDLLWQIVGATLRPYVSWNKSAWFYSTRGNNGKGTLVAMMRNLIGLRSCVSLPLAKMGEQFSLQQLAGATAILTDENDVGTYVDKAANLKAITTHDYLMVDRKHKDPISFQFWGFMVQCLNEKPLVSDRSESFYRRQIFIPFEKCFTGIEKRYIKDDFLQREDVLQYVLSRVLGTPDKRFMDDYYVLDVPASSQKMLDEYKRFNDPVRAFWFEFRDYFQWDLLPWGFLYDLFKAWFKEQHPSGRPLAKRAFDEALTGIIEDDPEWTTEPNKRYSSNRRIRVGEPLIETFDLRGWTSSSAPRGTQQALMPDLKDVYTGIVRVTSSTTEPDAGNGSVISHTHTVSLPVATEPVSEPSSTSQVDAESSQMTQSPSEQTPVAHTADDAVQNALTGPDPSPPAMGSGPRTVQEDGPGRSRRGDGTADPTTTTTEPPSPDPKHVIDEGTTPKKE